MKKNRECYLRSPGVRKILLTMRFLTLFFFCTAMHLSAAVHSQHVVFSFNLKNATFEDLMKEIRQHSDYYFIYKDSEVAGINKLNKRFKAVDIDEILRECLKGTGLTYSVEDKLIIIRKANEMHSRDTMVVKGEARLIKGTVVDEKKRPLAGVTVVIKGTSVGVATNVDGVFSITLPVDTATLIFTFVGMETEYVKIAALKKGETRKDLRVVMKEDKIALQDVVVTGYANIRKSSFTGSATQVSREEILKVSSRSLLDALQVFDPSLRIIKNNELGSDPNALPELYIRGRSGLPSVKELDMMESTDVSEFALTNNPNLPVFILDGFEVSIEKIFDFDVQRVKDITILKDAAATAIYGSRASNGVIVVETLAPQPGELRISYSGNLGITAPDLSSYNLMHSKEKLEAEVAAGLFEPWRFEGLYSAEDELNSLMWNYLQKRNRILIGVDNYWLSQPLRTEINHRHSVYIEGGAEHIRFGIELRYDNENGVMKKSYRDRMGAGVTLDYRFKGVQIRNQVSYDVVKAKDSPYGDFGDYTSKQPYDYWRDPDTGELLQTTTQWGNYGGSSDNPLYEAVIGNYSKNGYSELTNNLALNWYINDYLLIKGQFAVSYKDSHTDKFTDPESGTYGRIDLFKKGDLAKERKEEMNWNMNVFGAYNRTLGLHNFNFSAGFNVKATKDDYTKSKYRGFPDAKRDSPAYAYEIVEKPTFTDNKTRLVGMFLMLNYSFKDIYLFDASYRYDGSSQFGTDKKWAPFWSLGTGINLHNYEFMNGFYWIPMLKIKGNIGETGSANFEPYMARNTFEIMLDDWYPTGIGVKPKALGNPNLTWQKKFSWNIGAEIGVVGNRGVIEFNVYNEKTKSLINDVSIPSSSGYSKYKDNVGEVMNRGFEIALKSVRVYSDKDVDVILFGNMSHNVNKLLKISESLKEYNSRIDEFYEGYRDQSLVTNQFLLIYAESNKVYATPIMKYEEGNSTNTIYGMKSLGINPANGREVFQKRDGTITYTWSSDEQQKIGNEDPWGEGAFGLNFRYKNISLYTTFLYSFGGDKYNKTLLDNVENANLNNYNADKRVWTERWQNVGDVTPLKALKDRYYITRSTSRFVQKNNYVTFNSLTLSYDFNRELLDKIGFTSLRLQFNMKDVATFSTIKREMGLSYPFARTFNFSLSAGF